MQTIIFDKKVEKAEKALPPKIEKGIEILTDTLEDFENDIHAEPNYFYFCITYHNRHNLNHRV